MNPPKAQQRPEPRPRWWPLGLLVVLSAARFVQLGWFKDYERQFKFAAMGQWLLMAIPAALLWFLLFSRIRLRTRLIGLATLTLSLGLLAACFRMRGLNGDALPMVEWRWSKVGRPPAPTGEASPNAAPIAIRNPDDDYPQFQGPDRNARLPKRPFATNWVASPPRERWRVPVGEGWSGFAVSGQRAISLEQAGDREVVFALDLTSGRRLWASSYPARYASPEAGNGPRSVPTLFDGKVKWLVK
jgi:outer membrane protein assembly factor BamB